MKLSKPKPADIEGLLQLKNMLITIRDAATGAVTLAQHVQTSVDHELELGREQVRTHLERTDLRPKTLFKKVKSNWIVTLGSQQYIMGFRDNFADLEEGDPTCFWYHDCEVQTPPVVFFAPSMFQALMAVVLHFCNESQSATAPVIEPITPIDNQPS